MPEKADERRERLARALRENLKRRKAVSRAERAPADSIDKERTG